MNLTIIFYNKKVDLEYSVQQGLSQNSMRRIGCKHGVKEHQYPLEKAVFFNLIIRSNLELNAT